MQKDRDKSMEKDPNHRSQGFHQNAADQSKLPVFIHEEIKILYEVGFDVDPALLNTIVSLPRESLIGDLLAVIQDSKDRYPYIMSQVEMGELDGEETCFLMHAMFLLGELEAEEALDALLDILRQEDEFIELYIGEVISEGLWPIFYQTGRQQLAKLKEFICLPEGYTNFKPTILDSIEQIWCHAPERKPEVVKMFADLLEFYNSFSGDDETLDTEIVAYLVWSIMNMGAKELLPATEPLFQKGWVEEGICGSYSDVKDAVDAPPVFDYRQEILPIKEKYAVILSDLTDNFPDFGEIDIRDGFSGPYPPMRVVRDSEKKVGRNDPCPCGSGKKYKKCCGSEE